MTTDAWKSRWQASTEDIAAQNPIIQITISKPEVAGSMVTRYVTYLVQSEPIGHSVRRRWSEFLWLRDTLSKAYPGLFLPVLPTNSTFTGGTNVDGELVKSRVGLLGLFMNQLFSLPFLLGDTTLLSFLSITGEREFKAFVDSINKTNLADGPIVGVVAWRNMLDDLTSVTAPEQYSEELKKYLDTLKVSFSVLNDQCVASAKGSQVFLTQMTTTTTGFGVWADAECSVAELPAEGHLFRPPQIKKLSDATVVSMGHWSSTIGLNFKILDAVGLMIQEQLVQVDGFREHLRQRDHLASQLDKAEKERAKLLEDKSKAASAAASGNKGFMSRFSKSDTDLNELYNKKDEQVMMLADQLKRFNRALHFSEIFRFQELRGKALIQLLGIIVASNVQALEKSVSRWVEISSLAGLDMSDYNEQASVILSEGAPTESETTRRIGSGNAAGAAPPTIPAAIVTGHESDGNVVAPAHVYLAPETKEYVPDETVVDV